MERALSRVRLSASTEPISGFGAPAFTQNPTAERVTSAWVPAATLPVCASRSRSGRGNRATSKAAPSPISLVRTDVSANLISILLPVARSNSGITSSISDFMAPPLKTLIWFTSAIAQTPAVRPFSLSKGPPKRRPFDLLFKPMRQRLLSRRQRHRLDSWLGRHRRRFSLFLALGEDEGVAFDRDFADFVHHRAGAGRDQPTYDDVLLETVERIGLAVDRSFGEHAGRLLERSRGDERARLQRGLGDAKQYRMGDRKLLAFSGGPGVGVVEF